MGEDGGGVGSVGAEKQKKKREGVRERRDLGLQPKAYSVCTEGRYFLFVCFPFWLMGS